MVLPYGFGLPASNRPVPQDAVTARRILIAGPSRDAGIFEIASELAPLHPRNDTFPGEVFLRLGADALDRCGASRADPVPHPATCSDAVHAPEKRKVGGSTPPLTTSLAPGSRGADLVKRGSAVPLVMLSE
jgi:hypothetical protein